VLGTDVEGSTALGLNYSTGAEVRVWDSLHVSAGYASAGHTGRVRARWLGFGASLRRGDDGWMVQLESSQLFH
jgi:hypothetical protein